MIGELIDGELITQPRPAALQARRVAARDGARPFRFDRVKVGPGGWIILDEPELHLHGNALVPDIAGWRRERMPELPEVAALSSRPRGA